MFPRRASCRQPPIWLGALSRIEEGLSVYPREPRLVQLQDVVQGDLQIQRRQSRRRDLEELRSMESEIDAAADGASKQSLGQRVRTLADKYSNDSEVQTIANGLLRRLGLDELSTKTSLGSLASETATLTYPRPASSTEPAPTLRNTVSLPPPAADVVAAPPAPPAAVPAADTSCSSRGQASSARA